MAEGIGSAVGEDSGAFGGFSDAGPSIVTPAQCWAGPQGQLQVLTPPSSGSGIARASPPPPTPKSTPTPTARTNKCAITRRPSARPRCASPWEPAAHRPSSKVSRPRAPQETNSADYLQRLIRIAKQRARHPDSEHRYNESSKHPSPGASRPLSAAMADFLATFNFSAEKQAPRNNREVPSVEELQSRLLVALQDKVTPTRAEHLSLSVELRASVSFTIDLSDGENSGLEGLDTLDRSLGGLSSNGVAIDETTGQATRVVTASETLMAQSDNPVLQRAVTKHIIGAISAADGSTWVVRDLSRGSHGWSFTYICKDSHQHWSRQNSKNPVLPIIGEYSLKEADPTLMARPAFDCRGCAVITFDRSSRAITVKYDHTLLHKTVGELSALYPQPVRQLGPGALKLQQQKTPKKPAAEKKERRPASEKKKRESGQSKKREPKSLDENGQPQKRRKKNNGESQAQSSVPEGPMIPPDYPHTSQDNAPSWPERPSTHQAEAVHQSDSAQSSHSYPPGLVNDSGTAKQPTPQSGPASAVLPFNVSADEAARRMTIARKLLSDAGVNPDSLSPEQMNIFANQSPDLQKDSIAMLARYGAERLQIIHPSNRDKASAEPASASTSQAQSTTSANLSATPTTTKELSLQTESDPSLGKGGASIKHSAKIAATTPNSTPSRGKRGMGKSRLACFECKRRKVKCPKERPTCTQCESHGRACQYPPAKSRSRKSDAAVPREVILDDEEDDGQDEGDEEEDGNDETTQIAHQQNSQSLIHEEPQDAVYAQMPVAGMLTPQNEPPTVTAADTQSSIADHSYFHSDHGLSMPQPDLSHLSQSALNTTPGLALPQAPMYNAPQYDVNMSSVYQQPGLQTTGTQNVASKPSKRQPRGSNSANRRSHAQQQNAQTMDPGASSASWMTTGTTMPSAIPRDSTASPSYPQPPTANQQRPRQSDQMRVNSPHLHNNTTVHGQQTPSPTQSAQMLAAMQKQGRESPFPVRQRSASRTGRNSQNRTPNADARGYRPPPPQSQSAANDGVSATYNNQMHGSGAGTNANANPTGLSSPAAYPNPDTSTSQNPYNYNRASQPAATSSLNQTSASSTNQWASNSQSQQGQQSRPYENRPLSYSNNNNNTYSQSRNVAQPSLSVQNFDMRAAAQAKNQSAHVAKQAYSQYSAQSQPQSQAAHHHDPQPSQAANNHHLNHDGTDWYGFNNSGSNSLTSANQGWL